MASIIYCLCSLAAIICTGLLLRAYPNGRSPLLFWSGLCFAGLSAANLLLVVDKLWLTTVDISSWRSGLSLLSMCVLLYALIWETE